MYCTFNGSNLQYFNTKTLVLTIFFACLIFIKYHDIIHHTYYKRIYVCSFFISFKMLLEYTIQNVHCRLDYTIYYTY